VNHFRSPEDDKYGKARGECRGGSESLFLPLLLELSTGDEMLSEQTRLRLADEVAHQSIGEGEDAVILSFDSGYLYTCNETTKEFLSALDGKRTLGQIIDLLAKEYDVPREKLSADMTALAEKLIKEKLVVVQEKPAGE